MKNDAFKVLLIEDSLADARLINEMISDVRGINVRFEHALRLSSGIERLKRESFDVVLLDLGLPDSFGLETLSTLLKEELDIPVVVMTGLDDEDTGIKAVKMGAQDFLVKLQIEGNLIVRSLRYAVERARFEKTLGESEARYHSLYKNNNSIILLIDPESGRIVDSNEAACRFYGYSSSEIRGKSLSDISRGESNVGWLHQAESNKHVISRHCLSDGSIRDVEIYNGELNEKGQSLIYSIIHDVTEKRQAEDALRKTNLFLEAILNNTNMLLAYVDNSFDFIQVNRAFANMVGMDTDELKGCSYFSVLPDSGMRDVFLETLRNKKPHYRYAHPYRYNNSEDENYWDCSLTPVINDFGGTDGLVLSLSNVTTRVNAEKAVKESEEKFRTLFNTLAHGIVHIDSEARLIWANPAAEKILGFSCEELQGKSLQDMSWDMIDEDFEKCPVDFYPFVRTLKTGNPVKNQVLGFFNSREEDYRWVNVHTLPQFASGSEQPSSVYISFEDITAIKQAQSELLESERFLYTFFRHNPSPVVLSNLTDHRILDVNDAFEEFAGLDKDKVLGRRISDVGFLKLQENSSFGFEGQDGQGVKGMEVSLTRGDSKTNIGLASSISIEMNSEPCLLTVITDITDRKKTEEQLKRYMEELQESKHQLETNAVQMEKMNRSLKEMNASKNKFFSIIAHDLKSPLSAVLSISEYMTQGVDAMQAEEIRDFASRINRSLNSIFKLLENLLQWSMLQTDRVEFQPVEFNLKQLVDEVVEFYSYNAQKKRISLGSDVPETIKVRADKNMTETVLRNLLSNAVKFTRPGGQILLNARNMEKTAEICVQDNGIGIAPNDLSKLFRIDESVSTIGTEKEKGTGLGLILCREFVELNSGNIRAESLPGIGSCFIVNLPLAE